ncbi:hypothetical protein HK103_002667 [Boothiomyces macroporosus]|uniref:LEM domain-containing protein n=1 Tax=Boothiomyces macroporosus TaxID=261099 RepID=A0AAD5US71_9FUNG|nr:hypothetical protein HK103_002667 [Boothiomyces macroporosus]
MFQSIKKFFARRKSKKGAKEIVKRVESRQSIQNLNPKAAPKRSLLDLQDDLVDSIFEFAPFYGAMFDYPKYKDQLYDESEEVYNRFVEKMKLIEKEAKELDASKFTQQEKEDYTFLLNALEMQLGGLGFRELSVENNLSFLPRMFQTYFPLETDEDFELFSKKFHLVPSAIDSTLGLLKQGIEKNITINEAALNDLISMVEKTIQTDVTLSPYYVGHRLEKRGSPKDTFDSLILNEINGKFTQLKTFLDAEYRPHCRKSDGIFGLSGAKEVYEGFIFESTSVRHDAHELHQIGLDEIERIQKRMVQVKDLVFDGSMEEFKKAYKSKEAYPELYKNRQDIIPAIKDMMKDIDAVLPKYFNTIPEIPCDVVALTDSEEAVGPLASYIPGMGKRDGVFNVNLKLISELPISTLLAITVHEVSPGHHYQFSLLEGNNDIHLMKKLFSTNSFHEGWGLYTERLAEEMGVYKTPFDLYGRLELEMHRALRLVVDTGLHVYGWSIAKCCELMQTYLTLSPANILAEVIRYCKTPAQALSYKVGELKIISLRKKAEQELGHRFNIKDFHDVIVKKGSMTLEQLEIQVTDWIKRVKAEPVTLKDIQDSMVDYMFSEFPLFGAMFDFPKYKDTLGDNSYDNMLRSVDLLKKYLKDVQALDESLLSKTEKNERLNLITFLETSEMQIDPTKDFVVDHLRWDMSTMFSGYQPLATVNDVLNYKKRLSEFTIQIDNTIDRLQRAVKNNVTLPKESIDSLIETVTKAIFQEPSKSPYNLQEKLDKLQYVKKDVFHRDILDILNPAFKKFKEYLETDYINHARQYPGIYGLNDYTGIYENLIFAHTSVKYTSEELHQLGLQEVARISGRMEQVKDMVFDGSLAEFRAAINDKVTYPHLFFTREDTIPMYEKLMKEIDEILPKYFSKFPKSKCLVKAVAPEQEAGSAVAFYMPGRGDLPGTFYANLKDSNEKSLQDAVALVLHEANPGHHHQVSLEMEDESRHLLNKFIGFTSYAEGWGLYSEFLGEEMGMYKDPLSLYGRLEMEMHRAIRLVVDTGLHVKGWSIEQCMEVFRSNLTMPEEEALAEIKRYCVWPGQALSYKVGELKIKEVRKYAEDKLGYKFDIKEFHDVIIDNGSMSMEGVEHNVKVWVDSKLNAPETVKDLMDEFVHIRILGGPLDCEIHNYPLLPKDDLETNSVEEYKKFEEDFKKILERVENYDLKSLGAEDKQNLLNLKASVIDALNQAWFTLEIPTTHMFGPLTTLAETFRNYQPIHNANDVLNYKKRLEKIPANVDSLIERFRLGIAIKTTLPKISAETLIKLTERTIVEDPRTSAYNLVEKYSKLGVKESYLDSFILEVINPALTKYKNFLAGEYLPHARETLGVYGMPGYDYEKAIYFHTTVKYTAEELHQLGLQEVDRIYKRMEETKDSIFEGTMEEFRAALANKERFPSVHVNSRDDVIPLYEKLLTEIDEILPKYFNKIPSTKCEIEAVPPVAEAGAAMAYYMPGSDKVPGKFMVNLSLYEGKPMQQATALVLHEANPGHHHQISLVLEQEQHLMNKLSFVTAYAEGWGLYSEFLGEEMGMYKDALSLFGRLELEMHRALRLVVDTGIHSKGWDEDTAFGWMKKYITLSDSEIRSEVRRYGIMPGQALAYKVGEIKIRELRKYAENQLGEKFDVRGFHDVVLDHGPVSMETLEINIKDWVASLQ